MSGGVPKRVQISRIQRNTPSKAGNVVAKKALVLCNGRRSRKAMCNYVMRRTRKNVDIPGDSYPWWYNNPAVLAAVNLLVSHFSSLPTPEILVLVGISETLAGDLGTDTPVSDTMKHYARLDDTPHAAGNYDGLPSQELKNAVDLLNSMRIRAAVPSNILGGAKGPMRVQRHIVGTVHQAGLTALTQPVDPDDKIGYEMPLSSTRNIWVLGVVSDFTGSSDSFIPNDGAVLTSTYWHIHVDLDPNLWQGGGVPGGIAGKHPDIDPYPGRYFRIWWDKKNMRIANQCECTGTKPFGLCIDPIPPTICGDNEPKYWVKFVANNTDSEFHGVGAKWATGDDGGPAEYWMRVHFNDDGNLCSGCDRHPRVPTKPATIKIQPPGGGPVPDAWDPTSDLHKILSQMIFALNAQGQKGNNGGWGPFQAPYFELTW